MLKNQSNDENNFENFVILNILEDGTIVSITSNSITKEQKIALENIQTCCNNPSLVLKLVMFIEKKLNSIYNFILES